ncbi:hypothetical protein PGIGA_G00201040 [Pangasianodon gigas]|uniref:Uncharacterized protein n=1 Tax=Pangasianodon gigas TaxID=30993 RepID=A0ACC5WDQ8_PANGG|nr:hypothetical protein [Pangasianodon gigas]
MLLPVLISTTRLTHDTLIQTWSLPLIKIYLRPSKPIQIITFFPPAICYKRIEQPVELTGCSVQWRVKCLIHSGKNRISEVTRDGFITTENHVCSSSDPSASVSAGGQKKSADKMRHERL